MKCIMYIYIYIFVCIRMQCPTWTHEIHIYIHINIYCRSFGQINICIFHESVSWLMSDIKETFITCKRDLSPVIAFQWWNVYIHTYIRIWIYTFIYVHIYMHVCIYIHIYVFTYVIRKKDLYHTCHSSDGMYPYIYICIYIYAHRHLCTCNYACVYIQTHLYLPMSYAHRNARACIMEEGTLHLIS